MRVPRFDRPIEMPSTAAPASAARRGQAGAKFQSVSADGHHAKARFCGGERFEPRQDAFGTGSPAVGRRRHSGAIAASSS